MRFTFVKELQMVPGMFISTGLKDEYWRRCPVTFRFFSGHLISVQPLLKFITKVIYWTTCMSSLYGVRSTLWSQSPLSTTSSFIRSSGSERRKENEVPLHLCFRAPGRMGQLTLCTVCRTQWKRLWREERKIHSSLHVATTNPLLIIIPVEMVLFFSGFEK